MKVEVDIDDLTTIIFATGIIKTIEGLLASREKDPFVAPHLPYTKAHDNLVTVMNYARRPQADTTIKWDGKLAVKELDLLYRLNKQLEEQGEVSVEFGEKNIEIDTLSAKGFVRIGQAVTGVIWPGATRAEIKPIPRFIIDVTQRGRDKLIDTLNLNADKS